MAKNVEAGLKTFFKPHCNSSRRSTLGSLSNNDADGYKNVTLKVNSHHFKLYRAYFISFTSSNVGNCFWSWILKDCINVQEKKIKLHCCLVFPSSTKREFRHFHVVVAQRRLRNVQKSVMHVQSCCFANQTYYFFAVLVAVHVVVA